MSVSPTFLCIQPQFRLFVSFFRYHESRVVFSPHPASSERVYLPFCQDTGFL
ncbi:hypothetical protein NDU88_003575, partial [Pleurodeles waltl]